MIDEHVEMWGIIIVILALATAGLGGWLSVVQDHNLAARREACSYRCLHQTGRWPAEARWMGRDEKGRIKCECLDLEVTR